VGQLIWRPGGQVLEDRIVAGDKPVLFVAPFVKLDALQRLLASETRSENLKVVVRWRPADLLAGVSDLDIYPFLLDRGASLFSNEKLHAKLYVFESNSVFVTSANLTARGLGYGAPANLEVGAEASLLLEDWRSLHAILRESYRVSDIVYETFKRWLEKAKKELPLVPQFPAWPKFRRKEFTIQSLPATASPDELRGFYFSSDRTACAGDLERQAIQDLVSFNIPLALDTSDFLERLRTGFCATPFVRAFVAHLESTNSMSFGAATAWIHDTCEDVPVPYRYEVKDSVRKLFNWLSFFFDEIHWDRPGHAQVLYWQVK
jgi:hypothetical protein